MGSLLVGRAVVARSEARSVLGRSPAGEPQADALGPRSAGAGDLPPDRARPPDLIRGEWRLHREWFGASAMADLLGSDFWSRRGAQALRLPQLLLAHKDALFSHLTATLARPVQRRFRRPAVRSDQHVFRSELRPICPRGPSVGMATAATSGPTVRSWRSLWSSRRRACRWPTRCCRANTATARRYGCS